MQGGGSVYVIIAYVVVIFAMMYFFVMRPNKKNREKKELMLSKLEKNDVVVTTSGFIGKVIGIEGAVVIVEFGNNKNCRIPVRKEAIIDIEKPEDAIQKPEPVKEDKSKEDKTKK